MDGQYCERDLTVRQRVMLQLAAEGHGNKQIAMDLGVSRDTVRSTLRGTFATLHARNRTDAVVKAYRRGWVT
jgi:DNA-binding NarL/FixJ family response regulator